MNIRVETQNFDEVRRKLLIFPKEARPALTKALIRAGHMVEKDAKGKCPVRTGRLRSSITTEKKTWDEIHIGTNVVYGPFVEYGTRFMRAQPYLRPALAENQKKITDSVVSEVKKVLPSEKFGYRKTAQDILRR